MSFEEIAIVIALVGLAIVSFCAVSMTKSFKRVSAIAGPRGEKGSVGPIGEAGEPTKLPERLIFYKCASCGFRLGQNAKWGQQRDTNPTCCGMIMSRDYEIHNDEEPKKNPWEEMAFKEKFVSFMKPTGKRTTWTGPR